MNNLITGKRKAISNWLRQFVTIIDPEKQIYKVQECLLGIFNWGSFKTLPKPDYVLIFRSFFAKCEACEINSLETNPNFYYQVSIVHHKTNRIIVHETKHADEAFHFGYNLAHRLNTRLKDSASNTKQGKWLL
jgi:hypothetical protein